MGLVANTTLMPSTERFELWSQVLNSEFGPSAIESARARSFSGLLWRYELGGLCVHRIVADASIYRRPSRRRGSDPPAALQLVLARRGCCIVSQNGANSYIREGQLTSYTTWQPLKVESPTAFELVIVTLPELLMWRQFGRHTPQTALCLGGTEGIGGGIFNANTSTLNVINSTVFGNSPEPQIINEPKSLYQSPSGAHGAAFTHSCIVDTNVWGIRLGWPGAQWICNPSIPRS